MFRRICAQRAHHLSQIQPIGFLCKDFPRYIVPSFEPRYFHWSWLASWQATRVRPINSTNQEWLINIKEQYYQGLSIWQLPYDLWSIDAKSVVWNYQLKYVWRIIRRFMLQESQRFMNMVNLNLTYIELQEYREGFWVVKSSSKWQPRLMQKVLWICRRPVRSPC
jgi:hypothetical protein